jgi:hypothetical protein
MLTVITGWVSVSLGLASFAIFAVTLLRRPNDGSPPITQAGPEGWAKLAEGIAKVIEAFTKAGPSLSALIASLFFIGLAGYLSLKSPCKQTELKVVTSIANPTISRCLITGFGEGESNFDITVPSAYREEPQGCLSSVAQQLSKEPPLLILVVGNVDKRELRSKLIKVYGNNLGLGYQRAISLKHYLLTIHPFVSTAASSDTNSTVPMVESHIVALPGGPTQVASVSNLKDLAGDRCVEVIGIWPAHARAGADK